VLGVEVRRFAGSRVDRGRWETILGACSEAVAVLDGDGAVVLASPPLARMLGRDDLVGASLTALLHPDDVADFTGTLVSFLAEVGVSTWSQWRLRHSLGAWIDVEATATNMFDAPGVHGIVLSLRDVTEHNETFRTLQESRRRLEAVLDIAGAAIVVTDLDGHCVLANRRAGALVAAGAVEQLDRHREAVLAAGHAMQFDEVLEIDGERRDLLSAIVPVFDADGNATGLCAVLTDITDRLRASAEKEELKVALARAQRMDSLGQLAGGIAHDFNNLLAVILNYADFVAETLEDGHPAAADVAEISSATERAAALTRQLLVFSRHDHLRLEPVDVNEVALATQRLLARTLGEDVRLVVEPATTPVHALADAGQLEQVLMNLILNARDAQPRGGTVTVRVAEVVLTGADASRRGVRSGRHVRIDVRDDGEGMRPDVVERAFEPFFSTKPKGRGTGLGLSTVYGIVTNAEGHIEIDSRIKEGTTVTMHLPIVGAGSTASASAAAELDAPNGATIMVVEDEDAIRTLTHRILTRHGYQVVEAASPADALELWAGLARVPELLLTDVVMPGMSGKDLSDLLRETAPGMPVLFMSGYTDNVMDRYGLDAAGDSLLHKPFNAQQLLSAVQDVLGGRSGA
jgi:two-component system, cell cycle sensor histidine kinase and response regulator CckA